VSHELLLQRRIWKRRVDLLFSRIDTGDHRRNRLLGIIQGSVTTLGNKLIGVFVSFLSVPLTIHYLGAERYGIWLTLGSLLAWLSLSDFGIGNGLTNAVTSAAGQDRPDLVQMHVSNGIFVLSTLAVILGFVAFVIWPYINWSDLFGVTDARAKAELGPAVGMALLIFLVQFPLGVSSKVFMAYREGRLANYWGAVGNILSLLALLVVTHTKGGLPSLVLAVSGTSVLVNIFATAWLFLRHRPEVSPRVKAIDMSAIGAITHVGGQFFLIGIMALVTFQTDTLIIAHFLGASHVPVYSLTYKLFGYTGLPQTLVFSYLWTAYNEAIARKDIDWVKRTFHLSLAAGMVYTFAVVAILVFIARPFISWWGGPAVDPSYALVFWMAGWSIINAFTNPIACLLAAAAHLRIQMIYSFISTISNITLSLYLVHRWGTQGVIGATVISYAVFVCVPVFIDVEMLLKRLSHEV
jgi:O-antigen/teichoic acid export membrane protein